MGAGVSGPPPNTDRGVWILQATSSIMKREARTVDVWIREHLHSQGSLYSYGDCAYVVLICTWFITSTSSILGIPRSTHITVCTWSLIVRTHILVISNVKVAVISILVCCPESGVVCGLELVAWRCVGNVWPRLIDSFTVSLHSPNGRQIHPDFRAFEKTVGVSSSHFSPQYIAAYPACWYPNLYSD